MANNNIIIININNAIHHNLQFPCKGYFWKVVQFPFSVFYTHGSGYIHANKAIWIYVFTVTWCDETRCPSCIKLQSTDRMIHHTHSQRTHQHSQEKTLEDAYCVCGPLTEKQRKNRRKGLTQGFFSPSSSESLCVCARLLHCCSYLTTIQRFVRLSSEI